MYMHAPSINRHACTYIDKARNLVIPPKKNPKIYGLEKIRFL